MTLDGFPACICGTREPGEAIVDGTNRKGERVNVRRCTVCGLARTHPPPSLGNLQSTLYNSELGFKDQVSSMERFRAYASAILDAAARNGVPTGRLLDVGCGIGSLLLSARERGYETTGLEINPGAAAYGREHFGLDIRNAPVESLNGGGESFDVITLSQVLEHLEKPAETLNKLADLLRPSGIIIIESPNMDGIWPKLLGAKWYPYMPSQHLWHFTPASLRTVARFARLDLVEVTARRCIDYGLPRSLWWLTDLPGILNAGDNVMGVFRTPAPSFL